MKPLFIAVGGTGVEGVWVPETLNREFRNSLFRVSGTHSEEAIKSERKDIENAIKGATKVLSTRGTCTKSADCPIDDKGKPKDLAVKIRMVSEQDLAPALTQVIQNRVAEVDRIWKEASDKQRMACKEYLLRMAERISAERVNQAKPGVYSKVVAAYGAHIWPLVLASLLMGLLVFAFYQVWRPRRERIGGSEYGGIPEVANPSGLESLAEEVRRIKADTESCRTTLDKHGPTLQSVLLSIVRIDKTIVAFAAALPPAQNREGAAPVTPVPPDPASKRLVAVETKPLSTAMAIAPSIRWDGNWPFMHVPFEECGRERPFPSTETRAKLNLTSGFDAVACTSDGSVTIDDWSIIVVFETANRDSGFAYARLSLAATAFQDFFESDRWDGANAATLLPAKVRRNASGRWEPVSKGKVKC